LASPSIAATCGVHPAPAAANAHICMMRTILGIRSPLIAARRSFYSGRFAFPCR
jgi:hypothetical protein